MTRMFTFLKRRGWIALVALAAVVTFAVAASASTRGAERVAASAAVAADVTTCEGTTASQPTDLLPGSKFEIDAAIAPAAGSKRGTLPSAGANQVVDHAACLDWLTPVGIIQPEKPSGGGDDAFGQGTAENSPVPTVVNGSIPPNKSDLSNFGIYEERESSDTFVNVFWSRVQDPSGTTNMDFEFNKNKCVVVNNVATSDSNCSTNNLTPSRSVGDKLLLYDLSSGGTQATISLRTWDGSVWGPATALDTTQALGTINYSAITAANSRIGALSPLTFGEASVNLKALLGLSCGSFGSVYLKSRSSDSFSAEIKDFIAPKAVSISNCAPVIATVQSLYPNDTANLTGTGTLDGKVKFELFNNPTCTGSALFTESNLSLNGAASASTSNGPSATNKYAITAANLVAGGKYSWKVTYDQDSTHPSAISDCDTENFTLSSINNS